MSNYSRLLEGKTSVITGCNRGIGLAILKVFAYHGANIWACARQSSHDFEHQVNLLVQETGVSIKPVFFDLANNGAVKDGAKKILASKQPIDILVNNAGKISTALFQMTPPSVMEELFQINLFSQLTLTQTLSRNMSRHKSGSIIHVSSSAAIEGNEGRVAYAASKSALITAGKVMSRELARYNIRVNTIAPGLTDTEMMRSSTPEDVLEDTLARISMQRVANPIEIANVALFLASDLSSYMTGQVLRVDGGM